MAMTKKQIFSLLVLVVMAGSMFVFLIREPGAGGNDNPAPPLVPPSSVTSVEYSASAVPAKVIQVFPTATLVGSTGAFNVADVEAELRKVPGLSGVAGSEFIDTKDNVANFRAAVKFASVEKMASAAKAIKDTNAFKVYDIFPSALVSVPKDIEFKNEIAGLTQKYSLPNQQAQTIVTMDTMKGDEIEVKLTAVFQGQKITSLSGVIEKNLTASPQFSVVSGSYKISGFEDNFTISSQETLVQKPGLEAAKAFFDSAKQDYNSSIELNLEGKTMVLLAEKPNEADLNGFLSVYLGLESFEINADYNSFSFAISPDSNLGYSEFIAAFSTSLAGAGFVVKDTKLASASLFGAIMLLGGTKEKLVGDADEISKKNGISLELMQSARIDANSIFVEDQNFSFFLEGGYFPAYVRPLHSVGDDVNLSLLLVASKRTGIMQLQASEN